MILNNYFLKKNIFKKIVFFLFSCGFFVFIQNVYYLSVPQKVETQKIEPKRSKPKDRIQKIESKRSNAKRSKFQKIESHKIEF